MWSAVQFSRVSVTPQPGHAVPMARATTWSRARLYCDPYAAFCSGVLFAHLAFDLRGRGLIACWCSAAHCRLQKA
jgi:hypothetical protein